MNRATARLAGLLSLLTLAAGISGSLASTPVTASDMASLEPLYRLGFVGHLVDSAVYLAFTVLLYALLKPAGATLALLAAAMSFAGTVVAVAAAVYALAPLTILGETPWLDVFSPEQREALARLSRRLRAAGANISLVFFGFHLVCVGWLIVRSTFLPTLLGALCALGGACFVVNSATIFLAPQLADRLFPFLLAPGVLAQAGLALWLLATGAGETRWRAA